MSLLVFAGPSLAGVDRNHWPTLRFLPPASQGDLYRVAALRSTRAIGLVDGYFRDAAAPWHKEILWAMSEGVHVYGAASMGALRAAELDRFGMRGVGRIYEAFLTGRLLEDEQSRRADSGRFEDDDEVAVLHGPAEMGFRPISEAMVNIRLTLHAASLAEIISEPICRQLVEALKRRFYPDRTWQALFETQLSSCPAGVMDALRVWVADHHIDQKRLDALALLQRLATHDQHHPRPMTVDYTFNHTDSWELVRGTSPGMPPGVDPTGFDVLDELRLEPRRLRQLAERALSRLIAAGRVDHLDAALEDGAPVDRAALRTAARIAAGVTDGPGYRRWLCERGLDAEAFDTLLVEEHQAVRLLRRDRSRLEECMLEILRLDGEYSTYASRARQKSLAFDAWSAASSPDQSPETSELIRWYFSSRLGRTPPRLHSDHAMGLADHAMGLADHAMGLADHAMGLADHTMGLADHATELGFHDMAHFIDAIRKEWVVRTQVTGHVAST